MMYVYRKDLHEVDYTGPNAERISESDVYGMEVTMCELVGRDEKRRLCEQSYSTGIHFWNVYIDESCLRAWSDIVVDPPYFHELSVCQNEITEACGEYKDLLYVRVIPSRYSREVYNIHHEEVKVAKKRCVEVAFNGGFHKRIKYRLAQFCSNDKEIFFDFLNNFLCEIGICLHQLDDFDWDGEESRTLDFGRG